MVSPETRAVTTVVPIPVSSSRLSAAWNTRALARGMAVLRRFASKERFASSPHGQVISFSTALLVMKAEIVSIAMREATSPALWPPMPSHTAYRLVSGETRKLSSFTLRRRPTSVRPYASIMEVGPAYGLSPNASNPPAAGRPHGLGHLPDRALHAHEEGPGHDGVADVELGDLGEGGDLGDVAVVQAVPGVHHEAELAAEPRGVRHLAERGLAGAGVAGLGPGGGVDLDRPGVELVGLLDLLELGVHEEAHVDPRVLQRLDGGADLHAVEHDVEPALGRDLLPPLGDERDLVRL